MKNVQAFYAFLILALLNGCGGGAGSSGVPATGPQTTGKAAFTISIPLRSSQYLSANMQSFGVILNSVNGAAPSPAVAPLIVNTTPTGPNCTTSGSTLTCSAEFDVPIGNDQFTMISYAGTNGTGAILSTGAITQAINPGVANTVPLALGGVVDSIVVTLANATPASGPPASIPVTVTAKDASGATIVGAANYNNAITLSTSDAKNAPLSTNAVASPATAVTVNYNGAAVGTIIISATAPGVSASKITNATLTPKGTPVTAYGGIQDGGGFLTTSIDHSALTFAATSEQPSGPPFQYNGTYTTLANGFIKGTLTSSTDPTSVPGSIVYGREIPNVGLILEPTGTTTPPVDAQMKPPAKAGMALETVIGTCPGTVTYPVLFGQVPGTTFNTATDQAYTTGGSIAFTGSNWSVTQGQSYNVFGAPLAPSTGGSGSGTCANGIITDTSPGGGGKGVVNSLGFIVFADKPSGSTSSHVGGFGTVPPASPINVATLAAQSFTGFIYTVNNSNYKAMTPVSTVPAAGNTQTACAYQNFEANVPSLTQCGVISFGAQTTPGLIQATLTQGTSSATVWLIVNQYNGKFVVLGIGLPPGGGGPNETINVMLFQQ